MEDPKYIQISPQITEEAFQTLINTIEQLGYRQASLNQNDWKGARHFGNILLTEGVWDTKPDSVIREEKPTEITVNDLRGMLGAKKIACINIKYDPRISKREFERLLDALKAGGKAATGSLPNYEGFRKYGLLTISPNHWKSRVYQGVEPLTDFWKAVEMFEESEHLCPFKVGDVLYCKKLDSWSSRLSDNCPLKVCLKQEVKVEAIETGKDGTIHFKASYDGVSYGFCYIVVNEFIVMDTPTHKELSLLLSVTHEEGSQTSPMMISVPKI